MVIIKTKEEIDTIRVGGQRLAAVVQQISTMVRPGVTTSELDLKAEELIRAKGDQPAFLGYTPEGMKKEFPATLCTSVNDQIVHGIPDDRVLHDGDIISIDCGVVHKGLFTDHAVTVAVGEISDEVKALIRDTKEALRIGIAAAQPGNTVGDIGHAIETFVDGRYGIVRNLAGHGVGKAIHEDPYVPNYGSPGMGEELLPGMVIAIEPMLTLGGHKMKVASDQYTISTRDKSYSAHFEHTVAITEDGPEVLTVVPK